MEVDIVHPDTPTGRLGTRSIEPRDQDPRDNLRPSFSQIKGSMELLFPTVHSVNSVSLRTFVTPPGYQISRFFFTYAGAKRFSQDNIDTSFRRTAAIAPLALRVTSKPLGSRAYAHTQAAAVVLSTPKYLIFRDDPFKLITDPISELLVQSFVHNVRGYCRSVLSVVSQLADDKINAAFYPS